MEANPINVKFYATHERKVPFVDWMIGLKDSKGRDIIIARLARIRLGSIGDHKAVGDGVFELRIDYGPGYRVYFGREGKTLVILLCGGDKPSQGRDIELAKRLWDMYRREKNATDRF
jgi:putative addiction module killer protein